MPGTTNYVRCQTRWISHGVGPLSVVMLVALSLEGLCVQLPADAAVVQRPRTRADNQSVDHSSHKDSSVHGASTQAVTIDLEDVPQRDNLLTSGVSLSHRDRNTHRTYGNIPLQGGSSALRTRRQTDDTSAEADTPPQESATPFEALHEYIDLPTYRHIDRYGFASTNRDMPRLHIKAESWSNGPLQSSCFHLCTCSGSDADCSQHFGNLTFIPLLPPQTMFLNFSFNNVIKIEHHDFFSNVTQLRVLDLSHNGLSYAVGGAFKALLYLETLLLNYNQLNYINLDFILSIPFLKRLDLIRCLPYLGPMPSDFFHLHPLPHLRVLNLHDNELGLLNVTVFLPLARLEHLGLGHNQITQIIPDHMPRLSSLVMHSNRLYDFPETCNLTSVSYFPRLKLLYLDNNAVSALAHQAVCLPKLEVLDLSRNAFRELPPFTFHTTRFPRLRRLFFRSNSIKLRKLHHNAFSNQNLRLLSFVDNSVKFSRDDVVHPDSFAACPSLRIMELDDNIFTNIQDEKFQKLFGQLPNLQLLFLSYCQLYNITSNTFSGLSNLTMLYLSENALLEIPNGAFDDLHNLQTLVINSNRVSSIKDNTFNGRLLKKLTRLDLSGNPFQCDCGIRWFQQMMQSNAGPFNRSYTTYRCANLPDTPLLSFYLSEQACLLSHDASVFIVIVVAFILVTSMVVSVVFRFVHSA